MGEDRRICRSDLTKEKPAGTKNELEEEESRFSLKTGTEGKNRKILG